MTQNPYAQSQFGDSDTFAGDAPARTSIMAIMSLITSLLCCIPGLPALALLLGAGSLIGISRSGGRVKGSGMAITGIILGLLFSVVQIVIVAMVAWAFGMMTASTNQFLKMMEADDASGVRATMTASGQSEVTDEQITAFHDAYQAEWGTYIATPKGLIKMLGSYGKAGPAMNGYQQAQMTYAGSSVVPIVCEFTNGHGPVLLVIEPGAQPQTGMMPARNWGFIEADGDIVWLIPRP